MSCQRVCDRSRSVAIAQKTRSKFWSLNSVGRPNSAGRVDDGNRWKTVGRRWSGQSECGQPPADKSLLPEISHAHYWHINKCMWKFPAWKSAAKGALWTDPRRYPILFPCAHVFRMSSPICFVFLFSPRFEFRLLCLFSMQWFCNVLCVFGLQVGEFLVTFILKVHLEDSREKMLIVFWFFLFEVSSREALI